MRRLARLVIASLPLAIGFGWWRVLHAYVLAGPVGEERDLFFYCWPIMGAALFTLATTLAGAGLFFAARWVWRG